MVIIWIERGWGYDNSGNAGEEKRTGIYLRADRGAVRTASWNRAEGAGRDYADAKV